MASEFVHLHNHSDYSLLDGAQTVQTLVNTIDDLGMDSVALTEHGNMFSVIPYYKAAKKAGIKPIIGCETYVAVGSRFEKKPRADGGWGNNHLVLLAQNYKGYQNLMKLVTFGYLDGFYYRPRVDIDLLKEHNEGIICLSGCLKGEVTEKMLKDDWDGAKEAALRFAEIFENRFYLEVQNHGIPDEAQNIQNMKKLAGELNLPLVCTNDAHYAKHEHWEAHDVHICLGTGKDRDDPNRLRYATPEFYFKTQDQMYEMFKDVPNAIENTRKIADSIDIELPMGDYHLPNFPIPEDASDKDPDTYLQKLCETGVQNQYGDIKPELRSRLDHELKVIKKMGFAGYFLITADFVKYAKDNDIPVGPGRGSAAGSLVSYSLGITTIDPMRHNLLFERFLNPDRISMPDIDIDFCIERRGEVIDYIKDQYGEKSVTQIITFGKMKARQVIRDVGRVLGYSFGEIDRLAKLIPTTLNITLEDALKQSPDLREAGEGQYKDVIEYSKVLEGMNRHASTHAAGVVIAPGDLTDFVPLYRSPQGDVTSQYDMKGLETLGLLKLDFLGLRNLTVIDNALKLLKERGENIDIEKIPMDDAKVYKIFAKGLTIGVFQFESSGMREFLKKLKPTVIEDLIAMNALYRPGPMENIDDFISRKHGKKKIEYAHPVMEAILEETYGIIVYQEQVMQIAHEVAGFTLAEADIMRRAVGKKIKKLMDELKVKFIDGALEKHNIPKKRGKEIYELIEKFAEYGFNKSHSTAYAYVAYQTAWLKTHYPAEFMSANLTSEMSNIDRVVILINECRKLKIEVDPPDVNISSTNFRPVNHKTISFGLNAIKNVGTKALDQIVESRDKHGKFDSLFDFTANVSLKSVNRKVLESLNMAGALDGLEGNRAQKYAVIETALKYGQTIQENKARNQVDLFGASSANGQDTSMVPSLPQAEEWSEAQLLEKEKEVLGMYLSGHPLLKYAEDLEEFSNFDFTDNVEQPNGSKVRIGGSICDVKMHFDRKNNQMAFFKLDCLGGQAEILAFSDTFAKYKDLIKNDSVVFISGKPTDETDFSELKMIADDIVNVEKAREIYSKNVNIRIEPDQMSPTDVDALLNMAKEHVGGCGLMFHMASERGKQQRIYAHNVKVSAHSSFLKKLRDTYGKQNVWVSD
ncbi:MAG: DNA polymerase III subunit alpha [Candidatus Marinimicrobia bacterium]|jgi:DNA polymerase-3 subunit alpha|nr:DNA polymerase III subunit alpha [Candidatus Neomarinimicrobiota bacterium]MBT4063872.1 DNA polymerase III subunit alpha [Candidatus Neomarinimicrobiota bacterium]MBT4307133.1 DNA polymerase III subunit alpha [Candidatus Neomarinimicrobiota bacterium]MBT4453841.1 DNA polymerase III subunit alpha [Candidatus Neomarinimicrobiota bacterium]MBT4736628.1 DNA polymerase III subunit alpha [Candidatus Neomarinimicrobiota bacterium]